MYTFEGVNKKWGDRGFDSSMQQDEEDTWTWSSDKPVYEWQQEYTEDDIHDLEEELFETEDRIPIGNNFGDYEKIRVIRKGGPEEHAALNHFEEAKLHPVILENVERMAYKIPTPIQKNAIPLILRGYDLLACSQTGSGKTAAFMLPVLSKIHVKLSRASAPTSNRPGERQRRAEPMALIILPTRELGIQIFEEARRFTYKSRIRPVVIYGGADMRQQKEQLARGCDVLIATPGRLMDAMERGMVALDKVRYLVMDEADRILDMGFEPTIRRILLSSDLPRDESLQTIMFSATFPNEIQVLASDFMKDDYCRLRIGRIGGTTRDIFQKVIMVAEEDKMDTLVELLCSQPPSRTLIFVDTKRKADYLDDVLYGLHFPCISIHGDRSQRERESALRAFRSGKSPILIATTVASRGLDIRDVMHVINYDLSNDIDDYVHRIGRTARAGHPGLATSFYNENSMDIASQLTKLLIECGQDVPEFLQEFTTDDIPSDDEFVDPVSFEQMNLNDPDAAKYHGDPSGQSNF
ncbi:hypothetical protein BG011_001221 [Mortierella polycephala]|uniref:RNA helicase n=1 Tax=Mortierella polycephala TaxID=41804 RepID=A0A9P6U6D8_9FUNG|nr:hypothetical protein BG011_001221 [Mortierella polycephala]